jgi:DnaJ family protein C protein 13
MGPVGLDEMGKLFDGGKIDGDTRVWAQGMDGWRRLSMVGQLKWSLMVRTPGLLNDTEVLYGIVLYYERSCS